MPTIVARSRICTPIFILSMENVLFVLHAKAMNSLSGGILISWDKLGKTTNREPSPYQ